MKRVAINGYGRIGRNVHRQLLARFHGDLNVVAINASSTSEMRAYLLRYDSLHGRYDGDVTVKNDETITVNGTDVRIVKEKNPAECPWKDLAIDIVIESSGHFTDRRSVQAHCIAGAHKVIVTAPMKDDTPMFVLGVNDHLLKSDMDIISNASCTTNCVAPVIKVVHESFGVRQLLVGSVHAFTASQNLLDNKSREGNDLRRARAATLSVIPTETGAVKACTKIFPDLEGKIDGMAFRVPVPTVSCAYMAFTVENKTDADAVNGALRHASSTMLMKDILAVSDEQCVSIDFQTNSHSSIVDANFTKVVDGTAVQILSWYDNEWGYAMRVTEMLHKVASMMD